MSSILRTPSSWSSPSVKAARYFIQAPRSRSLQLVACRLKLVAWGLRLGTIWKACCLQLDACSLPLGTIVYAHGHEPARHVQQRQPLGRRAHCYGRKEPFQFINSDGTTKPLLSCLALPLAFRPMITPAPASVNLASCSSPSITG
jgi:hypothetical protein